MRIENESVWTRSVADAISRCNGLLRWLIPAMLSTITSLEQLITSDGPNLTNLPGYLEGLEQANITIVKQHNMGENYFLEKIRIPYLKS